eukprot:4406074-Pleurochrysis_carterae.AAC.1
MKKLAVPDIAYTNAEQHLCAVLQGVLLLSVGMEWLNCAPLMEALPVECAVLHRVAVPSGEERLSLPFLVNVESKA